MTNEQFKTATGIDPSMWVCIERKKDYANGQSASNSGGRMKLSSLTKRSDIIENDDWSDERLLCERVFRRSKSLYTFYIKDDILNADITSLSSLERFSKTFSEEDAYRYASTTYVFEEKNVEQDIIDEDEIIPKLVFKSIDENSFSLTNESIINGKDYMNFEGHFETLKVTTIDFPVSDDGLLVMNIGGANHTYNNQLRTIVYGARYDVQANGYICEWANEPLIAVLGVGKPSELKFISYKILRTSNGWEATPMETPAGHKLFKRRFLRKSDFVKAGLV